MAMISFIRRSHASSAHLAGAMLTYRFVRVNLLQGLPFADDGFDFVHQRLLS